MEPDSYSQIGQLLQYARNERRLSLAQASQLMHIRVRYLEALEHGALSELPGFAYTKGYLQAYASFLGLDKVEILRRFEQVEGELSKRGFYLPQVFSKEKKPAPWAVWGGLAAALAAYMLWFCFLQPPHSAISVVEPFHPQRVAVSAELAGRVPCLHPQVAYYPSCITVKPQAFGFIPLRRRVYSVMELANK